MPTSPAPDAAAPPGMCPGVAVLGGGGGDGGGDGNGSGGGDGAGGGGSGNGDGASGDGKKGGQGCGDPVCPITGRVFVETYDFGFSGPMSLRWVRQYSSRASNIDGELGFGWTHNFDFRLRERPDGVQLLDDGNRILEFPRRRGTEAVDHPLGYHLRRHGTGFLLRDSEGVTRSFGPKGADRWHHLSTISDNNGNSIVVRRDSRGRLLGLRDAAGREYRVHTTPVGKIERVEVALDATSTAWMDVVRYTYDAGGKLASATDAGGFVGRYEYDGHLLARHRSPGGPTYVYRYSGRDHDARCVETWGEDDQGRMPAGVLDEPKVIGTAKGIYYQRFTYEPLLRYSEVENGLGGIQRFFGDELGRVVKEVTPSGAVLESRFRPEDGAIAARSEPDGTVTHVKNGGRVRGFDSSRGPSIDNARDDEGFEVSIYRSERGEPAIVRRGFDERGNLRVMVHHDGSRESFEVDARGLVTKWFDRRGALTQYFHDAMGNCVAIVGPGGATERMDYDYLGRRLRHVDSAGRTTMWAWDRRSEPIEKRTSDGFVARVQYNANRKPTVVDEAGRITRYEWGGQGWLTRITQPSGASTEYGYDVQGNLRRIINAVGQAFSVGLDYAGRCTTWTTFEGARYRAGYDGADRLTYIDHPSEAVGPLGRTALEYDDASRISTLDCGDGTGVSFAYEGRGGPSKTTGNLITTTRQLDAFGRVHGEKLGDHELRVAWRGGAAVALESDVGLPVQYDFDLAGKLDRVAIGNKDRRVDRESGGDFLTFLGEKIVLRRRFGPAGRCIYQGLGTRMAGASDDELAQPGAPGTLFFIEYEYDVAGHLRGERRSDGRTIVYDLTSDGQVASRAVYRGATLERDEQIAYDATGTPRMRNARYDSLGRPAGVDGETFEYDARGRLVLRVTDSGLWRYEWNDLDQLVRVRAPSHVVVMEHDARGRRIKKRVLRDDALVSSTSYVWNNNLVVHEVDELGGATRTYDRVDGAWETFGHVDASAGATRATYYVLAPGGAVDMAVDENGAVVWDAENTVFGHREITHNAVDVTARFPNQFYDADVGLSYTWHRWYDARLGVFVTPDPLFLDGNLNPRAFAHNPLDACDPTGWHTIPVPAGMTPAQAMAQPGVNAQPGSAAVPGSVACPPSMLHRNNRAPANVQTAINNAGAAHGCHSCGARTSGFSNPGHWGADHQPPLSTFGPSGPAAGAIRLYPHCINCSRMQGGLMSHHATAVGPAAGMARNSALMPP